MPRKVVPIVKTTSCWRFLAAFALELAVGLWFNGNRIMKRR